MPYSAIKKVEATKKNSSKCVNRANNFSDFDDVSSLKSSPNVEEMLIDGDP